MENGVEVSKASTLPHVDGNGVDRQDRRARPARSPSRGDYTARRPRSPRGHKRSRDDDRDSYHRGGRGGSDPRRFRVHYEDAPSSRERHAYGDSDRPVSRGRHDDLDRPAGQRSRDSRDHASIKSRHDDHDRDYIRSDKRPRTRSPSPSRSGRTNGRGRFDRTRRDAEGLGRFHQGQQAASIKYSAQNVKQVREDTANRRLSAADAKDFSKDVAKSSQGVTDERMATKTSHLHIRYGCTNPLMYRCLC